jgi:hypothetical protein
MGISDFRLRLLAGAFAVDGSNSLSSQPRRFLRNFQVCPHCERLGRQSIVERLDERGPVISRSDGESFHLVLGDRPISYPAEKSSGKTGMMTVGFWYVRERNRESGEMTPCTETVVVILRKPPTSGVSLMRHLEKLADHLAERLIKPGDLATLYEFEGTRLQRVS